MKVPRGFGFCAAASRSSSSAALLVYRPQLIWHDRIGFLLGPATATNRTGGQNLLRSTAAGERSNPSRQPPPQRHTSPPHVGARATGIVRALAVIGLQCGPPHPLVCRCECQLPAQAGNRTRAGSMYCPRERCTIRRQVPKSLPHITDRLLRIVARQQATTRKRAISGNGRAPGAQRAFDTRWRGVHPAVDACQPAAHG